MENFNFREAYKRFAEYENIKGKKNWFIRSVFTHNLFLLLATIIFLILSFNAKYEQTGFLFLIVSGIYSIWLSIQDSENIYRNYFINIGVITFCYYLFIFVSPGYPVSDRFVFRVFLFPLLIMLPVFFFQRNSRKEDHKNINPYFIRQGALFKNEESSATDLIFVIVMSPVYLICFLLCVFYRV